MINFLYTHGNKLLESENCRGLELGGKLRIWSRFSYFQNFNLVSNILLCKIDSIENVKIRWLKKEILNEWKKRAKSRYWKFNSILLNSINSSTPAKKMKKKDKAFYCYLNLSHWKKKINFVTCCEFSIFFLSIFHS